MKALRWKQTYTSILSSTPRLGRFTPGTHRIGGWVQKILPPPEFDPRTVPSAASRYTVYPGPQNSDPYCEDREKPEQVK